MWVSNGLLVWSVLTLVMVAVCGLTVLVFQAQRHIYPVHLGGYCRL